MPLFDPSREVPGLAEALENENFGWDAAWLDRPEKICGWRVDSLNTHHLIWLETIGSPFMGGDWPLVPELAIENFIRIVSPGFNPQTGACRRAAFLWRFWSKMNGSAIPTFRRWLRLKPVPQVTPGEIITAIVKYIETSLADRPARSHVTNEKYYPTAAGLTHFLLTNHLAPDEAAARRVPLKKVFLWMKVVREANGGKLFKPSDQLIARWQMQQNQAN